MHASDLFRSCYGHESTGIWSAPGRANLIGEHTDYNQGLVLPFAIDRRTWCALNVRPDRTITAVSQIDTTPVSIDLNQLDPAAMTGWSAYVFGVVWALAERGVDLSTVPGVEIAVDSSVPVGAGLSSSAALECSVAVALNDVWDLHLDRAELAQVCQLAENQAVGAPTGIMDQSASLLASEGHALYLDCRDLSSRVVPLPLQRDSLAIMVIDTHVTHEHATGGYADRRASCEQAVAALELDSLRDLTRTDLEAASRLLDSTTFHRVRHVVSENERVQHTATLLEHNGPLAIGSLLTASHASLRDDFQVSIPELDLAVDAAIAHGALGARMTGGGFGGAAIALVPAGAIEDISYHVTHAFAARGFAAPEVFTVMPTEGARRDD